MKKKEHIPWKRYAVAYFMCGILMGVCMALLCCEEDRRYIYGPSCPRDTVYVVGDPDTVTVLPPDLSCDSCHNFHPHPHKKKHK